MEKHIKFHNDPLWLASKAIAKDNHFKIEKFLYQAEYYATGTLRNLIVSGLYKTKPAVLKIYKEARFSDEPLALRAWHHTNHSTWMTAPALFAYHAEPNNTGWLIMEKHPEKAKAFVSPISSSERKQFLEMYCEYRRNFPKKPHRPLHLAEQLPADQYHLFRLNSWIKLASDHNFNRQVHGQTPILNMRDLQPRLKKGFSLIKKVFVHQPMHWCHGHFKPKELFQCPDDRVYLTDFAHTKMYPDGYELAFMIWADWLMPAPWSLSYSRWRAGVQVWLDDLLPLARQMNLKNPKQLMRASLVERILGSILADVGATDRPKQEQHARLHHLYRLFDEFIS
jgi:hypothetical protein